MTRLRFQLPTKLLVAIFAKLKATDAKSDLHTSRVLLVALAWCFAWICEFDKLTST